MKGLRAIRLSFLPVAMTFLTCAILDLAVSEAAGVPYDLMQVAGSSDRGPEIIMLAQADPVDEDVQAMIMKIEGNKVTVRTNRGTGRSKTLVVLNASSFRVGELVRLNGNSISKIATGIRPKTPPMATPMPLPDPIRPKTPPTATPMPLPDPK
jgi:hypothetical protein